jgi:hypothetical protein
MSFKDSIKNYLFGTEIKEFYEELKERNPEQESKLNKEKNRYLFWGKIVPGTIEMGGLVAFCMQPNLGGILGLSGSISLGEETRHKVNQIYSLKKRNYFNEEKFNSNQNSLKLF